MSAGDVDQEAWAGALLHHHAVRGPSGFAYAPALRQSLGERPVDLLHLHGLWMYCSVATHRWSVTHRRPYVISPHGMLDPWALANSGWKKRLARWFYEDANLRDAGCIHALCEPERQAIRDCGLANPICVIPNGVDPPPVALPALPEWRRQLPSDALVLLYLGRLHPKKRVLELIQAWHSARSSAPADKSPWHLIIAGPGPADYVQQLHDCIEQLALSENVRLVGAQYGAAKQATLGAAHGFILPSVSEGLPMAALEAWAWGLPALLTPQCNLPEGFAVGAALRIEPDRDAIAAGLATLFAASGTTRCDIGQRGRELVNAHFTWTRVADDFDAVYRWLLGSGDRPNCVKTT
jgi:poly(glycerol-phosphate) alpha-glucosyltransferase